MSLFRKPLFWVVLVLIVAIVVVAVVVVGGNSDEENNEPESQAATTEETATYDDPFAYCAAVGTIDEPDERYTGDDVPDAVMKALEATMEENAPETLTAEDTVWRCVEGQVWACFSGADTACTNEQGFVAESWYQLSAPQEGE